MSFLLRAKNRQRNKAPGPENPVPSRSKPTMMTTSRPASNMRSSGGGQVQQLVQRQRPQLQQKSLQLNAINQQQQNQGQQGAFHDIISMEEGEFPATECRQTSILSQSKNFNVRGKTPSISITPLIVHLPSFRCSGRCPIECVPTSYTYNAK